MNDQPYRDMLARHSLLPRHDLTDATAALQRVLAGSGATLAGPEFDIVHRLIGLRAGQQRDASANRQRPFVKNYERRRQRGEKASADHLDSRFIARSYRSKAGCLAYKVYVPSAYCGEPLPLVVMLHGCTQSVDDFAAGTRMNALGEEGSFFVAYPEQAVRANPSKCWNWFDAKHQRRDLGEPALIVGITREIAHDYAVDATRVYIAGLSAGGAAAAVLAMTYPDLYAAAGIHSGLPGGCAADMPSAFAAMRGDAVTSAGVRTNGRRVPTIVFHGDRDTTVHPSNGDRIAADATVEGLHATTRDGRVPGGHRYRCTRYADANGRVMLEQWVIHGAGHAWSGGSAAGSYTDPRGPDASREMIRFFFSHGVVS